MAELINLRLARKAKARGEADRLAAVNCVAHGRSKAEKQLSRAEAERARLRLDGLKRDE